MHVPKGARDPSLAHNDGYLVEGLGQQSPEIPIVIGAAHAGPRIALDGVVEIGKAQRIAKKEHRRIVAYDVPVTLFCVELQGEAADVPLRISGAALAGNGRKAREHGGLLADFGENFRLRVAAVDEQSEKILATTDDIAERVCEATCHD